MKNFIQTLKNIWSIEDLRQRILLTLGFILIFRIGSYVILPGVDVTVLDPTKGGGDSEGLAGLLDLFTGGAFNRASIFALGIMPYISASIIMQLAGIAVPAIQKMQREGESGRKKITLYTRILTVGVTLLQAPGYLSMSVIGNQAALNPDVLWWVTCVTIMVVGTLFVMWMGEKITDRGIGNGISLLIMIGIIAGLPGSYVQDFLKQTGEGGGGLMFVVVELAILLLIIAACVALVQATRRVPVQFAKRVVGNKQYGGVRQYIPLKVNAAGVMPIIFAQAIMFVPLYLAQAMSVEPGTASFLNKLSDFKSLPYNIIFFILVVAFTYFYTAITVNPNQMADDMKRQGGFIPGIKPGRKTADFLDTLLSRITLPGSIFLGLIAILPAVASLFGIADGFAIFFGGTSLLIMVGVVLDTLQQIESHLLSRHYDGLMKSGKIKGRSSTFGMAG
ncbi:MAG: preprotein translocase subunit SecY [Bacteroidota bacterium]